jgi:aminoglycoside phosphotransferase (APT) family kinase protein
MSSRAGIYYWKCDRAAALHGTSRGAGGRAPEAVMAALAGVLNSRIGGPAWQLASAGGQGNHLTFTAESGARRYFVRVEDGPEHDDYLAVESEIMRRLRAAGMPVPAVHYCDVARRELPFAFHLLDCVPEPDLNSHLKAGRLDLNAVLGEIGGWIARWQQRVPIENCGPFDRALMERSGRLAGLHTSASGYFFLNLARHLDFLVARDFLSRVDAGRMFRLLEAQRELLDSGAPCLVHKDMALWNVLGTPARVTAFIDWDDAIGGDPMDDLSLLACFHPPEAVAAAIDAYATVRPLPVDHMRRFWAHLLRNMIVKSVIRIGAGYFGGSGALFIHAAGADGATFRAFTLARLHAAVRGLEAGRTAVAFD